MREDILTKEKMLELLSEYDEDTLLLALYYIVDIQKNCTDKKKLIEVIQERKAKEKVF